MLKLPLLIFIVVFGVSITLTQYLAYQQYKIAKEKQRAELIHEAADAKDRFRNILFNDIAAANTLAIVYKQYGVPAKFDSIARQILQTSRYAEALQITENGIVRNAYPDALYKGTIGTNINVDPVRKAEEARAVDRKDIYFAGPRRLRFGDTGILGKVPILADNRVIAVTTVLTRLPAIKKELEPEKGDKNKFAYELVKIKGKDTSSFPLSFAKPAVKSEYHDIEIPEGDWLLRVSYGQGHTADKFPYELSAVGALFSFIVALLAYRKAQEPYKLNKIIDEKTEQLAKSEKYFRTLIETSSDAIVLLSADGKVMYQTPSAEKILGYSLAEMQEIDGIELIHPDDRAGDNEMFEHIISNPGTVVQRKHRIKHKNGSYIDIEGTYRNLLHDENVSAIVYSYKDITDRKQTEQLVLKEKELSETIINSLPGIFYLRDEQGRALRWNKNLEEVTGYNAEEIERALLRNYVAEEDLETLRRAAEKTFKEGFATAEVRVVTKKGHMIPYLLTQRPVYYGGQLCVLGTGIDISQRLRAEDELRSSEQKYKMLFDSNPSPLTMVAKDDLSFIAVNDAVANLYGYEKEELLRMSIKELIPEEDLQKLRERFQMGITGTTDFGIIRQVRRDRSIINVHIIAHDFIFEDRPVRLSLIIDVTERLKAEESLRESENRFRSAFEDSAIGMGLTSIEKDSMGRWLKVNKSLCEMLGYTEAELLSLTFMQITHPEDLARDVAAQNRILRGESDTYRLEKRYIHKNGSFIWINLNVSIVRNKDNQPIYLVAQIENITEKVESQIKFQALVENFIVGVYIHQNGRIVYVNPRLLEESGYVAADLIGEPIENFIYKDDLGLVKKTTEAREKEHIDTVRYEARFVKKDGQPMWFEIFGSRTVYQGAPALMGTMVNIADRKKAEEEIHRLTRLYQFMSSINESMLKSEDTNQVYADACRIAVEIGGFQMAWIGTYDEKNDRTIPLTWSGHEDGFFAKINVPGMKVSESIIPSARAIRERTHFYYNDIANDLDIPSGIKREMIKRSYLSGVSFPIFVGGKIVAAMVLLMSEPFFFTEEEIELLRDVTNNITYALDKIRILELQNQSEANLKSIFETTDVSYLLLNTNYDIVALNQQMKDVYVAVTDIELNEGDNLIELLLPEKRESTKAIYDKVVLTNKAVDYESSYLKDGRYTHLIANVKPIHDGKKTIGICISAIDITERKTAYEELAKSEANLRSIFDTTEVNYMLLDTNYDIVALNQQSADWQRQLTGVIFEKGVNVIKALPPEKRESTKALYDKIILTNQQEDYETSYLNDGVYTHFLANVKPIHDGKKVIGLCITGINITARKNALEKLEESNENLKKHAKELAISNAELEQFAYVASHDLQEPLRMVTSFMTQLEKKYGDVVDDKGRQYIRFAVDGAKRMRQIILDLLDFSRVGSSDDDMEEVNFNKLMTEILALYRRQIEELNAKVSIGNLPTLHIHKTPVRQVFQNLVGNSLKYHRKDAAPVIEISCKETKTHYQFSVKDNGIGIVPEYFDKIFIIFQRLHNKDEYSGTGMGLAITKKIVESMGGKIWLESEEGKGSTFYFTILKK